MGKIDFFEMLKDSLLEELGPRLLQEGLNMAMPELGDLIMTAILNFKQKLPSETQALFP